MSVAGTPTVTCVPLTKVVVTGEPFNATTAPDIKPEPFTVKVSALPPAVTVDGEMLVITGAGSVMANGSVLESRLPRLAVTAADPVCAIRFALTAAVICVGLRKVVVNGTLFQRTVTPDAKPEPFTVRVNAGPPEVAEDGERLVRMRLEVIVNGRAEGA
jgi:hypothetical protein